MPSVKSFPIQVLESLAEISTGISGISGAPSVATPIDRSGTITVGGDAQELMPAVLARAGFYVQNTSDDYLYINWVTTASTLSLRIDVGSLYEWPSTQAPIGAISIFGETTGQTYFAGEF